ncbi:MAG: hypothetical protein ACMXYF_00970 [Candidatus Woesearchaeota archaeon]
MALYEIRTLYSAIKTYTFVFGLGVASGMYLGYQVFHPKEFRLETPPKKIQKSNKDQVLYYLHEREAARTYQRKEPICKYPKDTKSI